MTTYYVDKRVAVNGNGTIGSPYKAINEVCSPTIGSNAVIEIVENSGDYYLSDCTYIEQNKIYLNHPNLNTITWNFNGNTLTDEKQLCNPALNEWHPSSTAGLYYCTGINNANPNINTVISAIVDDIWDTQSTSLFGAYPTITNRSIKWGYGNVDGLAFNTVYVRGINPTETGHSVLVSIINRLLVQSDSVTNPANEVFNDGIFKGGGWTQMYFKNTTNTITFNRCSFENVDDYPVNHKCNAIFNFCIFKNSGHLAGSSYYNNITMNHCHIENTHTICKLQSTTGTTATIINCSSKNLLAGAIQHDNAVNTLIEHHNQFHIDMVNIHGGDALALTTGTRQWTTTASTDLPASTSTTLATSVDPVINADGSLQQTSPCIDAGVVIAGVNDGSQTDLWGYPIFGHAPNIGASQQYGHATAEGTLTFKWKTGYSSADVSGNLNILSFDGTTDSAISYDADNNLIKITDGTNTASKALTVVADTEYMIQATWGLVSGSPKMQIAVNGTAGTQATFAGTFSPSDIYFGLENEELQYVKDFMVYKEATWL